jgi:nucleoside phosphorylase
MGILEAYDKTGTPVITPDKVYGAKIRQADTCIVTFSYMVLRKVLEEFRHELAGQAGSANGPIDIYYLPEQDVLFYMTPIGAPAAACLLQEVQYLTGAVNFIFFGSCGVIDEAARDKVIVPTLAYREEGFSYHYAAPSDYIDIENHGLVETVLTQHGIPCISGKTWTTDAIYMETDNKVRRRKEEGCLCVEMESSALQAISTYLSVNLYIYFFTGDIVGEEWERADLGGHRERDKQLFCFEAALTIAEYVRR